MGGLDMGWKEHPALLDHRRLVEISSVWHLQKCYRLESISTYGLDFLSMELSQIHLCCSLFIDFRMIVRCNEDQDESDEGTA